jgi:hypothetical protein
MALDSIHDGMGIGSNDWKAKSNRKNHGSCKDELRNSLKLKIELYKEQVRLAK